MKFFVLGANGMAGHTICLYLQEQGHEVLGFDLKESSLVKSVSGNAKDTDFLRKVICEGKFDSVINAIGLLNQTADKYKADAVYLNSYLPHSLADITKDMDTNVIHMSTDCVFSGKKGNYTEADFRDGETFYDRTKAMGELDDDKNITLRNSIIGPDINKDGIGLFNWFMKQSGEINGYRKAMWTGLTTLQLAKVMEAAAKKKATGLYNMVYTSNISKAELLKLFNKYFRNNKLQITDVDGIVADKTLVRTNFDFDYLVPDYETMVSDMAEWIYSHKSLYPHYNL